MGRPVWFSFSCLVAYVMSSRNYFCYSSGLSNPKDEALWSAFKAKHCSCKTEFREEVQRWDSLCGSNTLALHIIVQFLTILLLFFFSQTGFMPYQMYRLDLMLVHSKYKILASFVSETGKVGQEKGGSVAVSIWPQILSPAVVTSRCAQGRRNINHHAFFSSSPSLWQFSSQTSWSRSLCSLQPSMDFSWTNTSTPLEAIHSTGSHTSFWYLQYSVSQSN